METGSLAAIDMLPMLDSINPSALLATLYLLTGNRPGARIATYAAGIFVAYLSLGVLLMFGVDTLFDKWNDILWSPTAFAVQGAVGAALLIWSIAADPKAESQLRLVVILRARHPHL